MTPVGRRHFQHPDAARAWTAIERLNETLQVQLLDELDALIRSASTTGSSLSGKGRIAVAAIRKAAAVLEEAPSITQYRQLYGERPDLGLPPDSNVRRWLGNRGWPECVALAGLANTIADVSSPLAGRTYRFDDGEIFVALRECARDLACVPTTPTYLEWAHRPDVLMRPGR